MPPFNDGHAFEQEVRRIARLLWPAAQYGGAAMEDGQERDGVFVSDEFVHVIECTVSRSKQKATEDLAKIQKLVRKLGARYSQKFIKGWFVTLEEPNADQRSVFQRVQGRIVAVSFDQFRSRLVDARSYLTLRDNYPFGSVRDPSSDSTKTPLEYVRLDILDQESNLHSLESILDRLLSGTRFELLGDYGAGKSATLRELYLLTARRFLEGKTLAFPVLLNLRDHHGQTDPVEALERHARRVGFSPPESLVRAWRAGLTILMLDGFDEIATAGWAGKTKRLKDLRFRSMELVRAFVRETVGPAGLIVAGRAHFFDSPREMATALGLPASTTMLNLSEFNDEQISQFLSRFGWREVVPAWVPSRPLLLGYLAAHDLLQETLRVEAGSTPAVGWNALLERISTREAEIEAGIDSDTVRRLIEHLATIARNSPDGLGPLSPDQITSAFSTVCGYPPDDRGAVLLQRLPGLGGHSAEDGSRIFIDRDFAAAAQGGAVFTYIESPYAAQPDSDNWQSAVRTLGAELAAYRCLQAGFPPAKIAAALRHTLTIARSHTLAADIFLVIAQLGLEYDGPKVFLREVLIPDMRLDDHDYSAVEFQDCVVALLDLATGVAHPPRFVRCYFSLIEGRTSPRDLPSEFFVDCTVEAFENPAQTTSAILALSLPLATKVVLTVLKKLYAQSGSGRRESAFSRGLDARSQQLVPDALSLLKRTGFATPSKQGAQIVWLPTKSSEIRRRAHSMLAAPHSSTDPVVQESRILG